MPSVLVTGASRGIGLAITRHMSERGWDVYATARSDDDLRELGGLSHVHPLRLDITDRSAIAGLPGQLPARLDDHALTSRHPKRRYRCDNVSRAQLALVSVTPTAVTDAVFAGAATAK